MFQRLRKLLTSVPSITVVGLVSAYLLVGFFVLPAVLRWQLGKQIAAGGYVLQVGDLRFDPLRLRLEVDRVSLTDRSGAPVLGFDNLMVDLEWRSITDRAWTIADSRLLAPMPRIDRAKDGSHNFSALLAQFVSDAPEHTTQGTTVPPVRLELLLLTDGRIGWLDQQLEQPLASAPSPGFARPPEEVRGNLGAARPFLVSRIAPLHLQLFGLSTAGSNSGSRMPRRAWYR